MRRSPHASHDHAGSRRTYTFPRFFHRPQQHRTQSPAQTKRRSHPHNWFRRQKYRLFRKRSPRERSATSLENPIQQRVESAFDQRRHKRSVATKTKNRIAITPFIVKKAAFSLRRSRGETIRCSYSNSPATTAIPIHAAEP